MLKLFRWLFMLGLVASFSTSVAAADDDRSGPRAVTLWWVIFNNPGNCIANPGAVEQCGALDIFGAEFLESVANGAPDPSLITPNLDSGLAVIYATGAKTNSRGGVRLAASIYRNDGQAPLDFSGANVVDPLGLGRAFENADAEVHLVIRDHGRVVTRGLLEQISGFLDPYCSDPLLLYFSGRNTCADAQFAVFAPGESGRDAVISLSSQQEVRNAGAWLFRNGDMLQAVIKTRL